MVSVTTVSCRAGSAFDATASLTDSASARVERLRLSVRRAAPAVTTRSTVWPPLPMHSPLPLQPMQLPQPLKQPRAPLQQQLPRTMESFTAVTAFFPGQSRRATGTSRWPCGGVLVDARGGRCRGGGCSSHSSSGRCPWQHADLLEQRSPRAAIADRRRGAAAQANVTLTSTFLGGVASVTRRGTADRYFRNASRHRAVVAAASISFLSSSVQISSFAFLSLGTPTKSSRHATGVLFREDPFLDISSKRAAPE